VLVFTAALSLVTGVLFGAAPALAAASVQATDLLRESRGTPRSSLRARSALVMLQLAVCVILVVGATGFVRSLRERLRTDLNFAPAGLATLTLDPSMTGYTPERLATLVPALIERAAALPDVRSAAAGTRVPIRRGGGSGFFVTVPGYEPAADEELRIERGLVSAGWFRTVGLPIVRGREFTEGEDRAGERVAVINEVMAEQWWRGRDPLGATFSLRGEDFTIVGIAANTAWSGLEVGADPFVYVPTGSAPESILSASLTLIVKTAGDAAHVMTGLRAALADVDPGIAPQRITTLESELRDMLAPQRTTAGLLLGFAALAFLLAVIGVYGVVGYTVSLRGRDLGIRMALGATRAQVSRMVVTGIAPAALLGLGAGTLAAAALARTLESTVPDLAGIRLPAFAFAVPFLALAAALAAWLPARRAARTDPALAVRAD
jgi:predicted permease